MIRLIQVIPREDHFILHILLTILPDVPGIKITLPRQRSTAETIETYLFIKGYYIYQTRMIVVILILSFRSYSNKESEEKEVTYNGTHDTGAEGISGQCLFDGYFIQIIQISSRLILSLWLKFSLLITPSIIYIYLQVMKKYQLSGATNTTQKSQTYLKMKLWRILNIISGF